MSPGVPPLELLVWYGALAAGLLVSVGLFLSFKAELRRIERALRADCKACKEDAAGQRQEIEVLRNELRARDCSAAPPPVPSGIAGLNVSKRNQALRLHRGGHSTAQIAGALGIPENEVNLLIKVHGILLEQY